MTPCQNVHSPFLMTACNVALTTSPFAPRVPHPRRAASPRLNRSPCGVSRKSCPNARPRPEPVEGSSHLDAEARAIGDQQTRVPRTQFTQLSGRRKYRKVCIFPANHHHFRPIQRESQRRANGISIITRFRCHCRCKVEIAVFALFNNAVQYGQEDMEVNRGSCQVALNKVCYDRR